MGGPSRQQLPGQGPQGHTAGMVEIEMAHLNWTRLREFPKISEGFALCSNPSQPFGQLQSLGLKKPSPVEI